jgi:uncharacterized membrane protein
MKSTAQIKEHPIHPMLIPYPFALLSSAVVFDVGSRMTGKSSWSQTASHLATAGIGTALVAAVPGIVDYFGSIPSGTRAKRTATTHAISNVSALACFALARSQRRPGGRLSNGALALELLGTGLLSVGGWLGGQLVYHEHVGVVEDEPALTPARSLASDASTLPPAEEVAAMPLTQTASGSASGTDAP